MLTETIRALIAQADQAIREERFDDLMEFYTEDAVLVVRPGLEVRGKTAIRAAFVKIAEYFNHSLVPSQGNMIVIDAGDTALVLSGVTSCKSLEQFSYRPHYILRGVGDIPPKA